MAGESSIGEQQQLLRVLDEVAREDLSGIASIYRVSESLGFDFVGKVEAREELLALTRDLQEAGCVKILGAEGDEGRKMVHGGISVTEEGRSRVEAT